MSKIDGGRPIVIAHRGGAAEARENTVEAFERVIALGYPGVEFDVRRSHDGVPVVVHDDRIRRRGRRIAVADVLAESCGLPRLDDVLGLDWGRTVIMVEVKPTAHDAALGAHVALALASKGLARQACVASFSDGVVRGAAEAAPEIPLMGLLDRDSSPASFDGVDLFAWGVDLRLVAPTRVAGWKSGGREVWTWTIKDVTGFERARAAGVDGFITDIPGTLLGLM